MMFSSEEVKPFAFGRLEGKDIPEDQRVISIFRKKREDEDKKREEQQRLQQAASEKEHAPKPPAGKAPAPKTPVPKAPPAKAAPAAPGAEAPAPEDGATAEEALPVPKLHLRPRKPTRGNFKAMVSGEGRPKGTFTGFTAAKAPGPDGVRALLLDSEREAEEEAEKTAAQKREELMQQARAEAAALKERARAESQKQGYDEGLVKARAEVRAELMPVLEKFAKEIQGLANARAEVLRAAEREILELALLIGKKVLHAELRLHPEAVAQVVRHALGRAIGWGRVRVLANPADCALLDEVKGAIEAGMEGVSIAQFIPTPSIERGGCALESNLGEVDVRLGLQVGEVEQALRAALEERLAEGALPAPAQVQAQAKPAATTPPATTPPAPEPPKIPESEVLSYRPRELGGPKGGGA
ncbi:MAG: FliH/SctL family protein [Nitrospinota bacterium]